MSGSVVSHQEAVSTSLQERIDTYFLLARLFREAPSPDFLRGAEGVVSGAEALAVEYARLFVVPGEHAVRPYESVYCDTIAIDTSTACSAYFDPAPLGGISGLLHGPSTTAVRAFYRQAGFELDPAMGELPDHLGIELEFIGRLLERAAEQQAAEFFSAHLGRWVFRCLRDLKRHAQAGFYRAIAEMAEAFLRSEEQTFAMTHERRV